MSYAHGFSSGNEKKKSNLITLLRDIDRDGVVDERSDLLTVLNSPFGVAWIDDTLYVAATDAILAYPYRLGQMQITSVPRVLTPLPGGPINHHWTKDLALSPDGRFLYVSVGSNSNIAENGIEAEKGRAAIWQVDRRTGAARVYASGLRNPNGLTFHPDTGTLWTIVNERDELGPNLVPSMNSAVPEQFRHGAFVGQHGSWNREAFNGYKVVYIPFENGAPSGKTQDVVTGFIDGDRTHGRPVGVGIDGTGVLLVADDAGNTVWRVAAADGSITPQPIGTDMIGQPRARSQPSGNIGRASSESQTGQPTQSMALPPPHKLTSLQPCFPAHPARRNEEASPTRIYLQDGWQGK